MNLYTVIRCKLIQESECSYQSWHDAFVRHIRKSKQYYGILVPSISSKRRKRRNEIVAWRHWRLIWPEKWGNEIRKSFFNPQISNRQCCQLYGIEVKSSVYKSHYEVGNTALRFPIRSHLIFEEFVFKSLFPWISSSTFKTLFVILWKNREEMYFRI